MNGHVVTTMIEISEQQIEFINQHGERDYPHECCGLLLGRFAEGGRKIVTDTYPISNAREEAAKRNRFLITPEELLRGEQHARELGLDIVGFYHSHPDHPAAPSQYDADHAWPTYSYVIVSVKDGHAADLHSWELETDRSRFNQEEIMQSQELAT